RTSSAPPSCPPGPSPARSAPRSCCGCSPAPRPPAPEGDLMALLEAQHLHLAYDRREVVHDLSLSLPEGRITIIVGANGSGKSTLLRGMSRLLTPRSGGVLLDGRALHSLRGKELARRLGLLPQTPIAPDGVTVRELVTRGRYPHQGPLPPWSAEDASAVPAAPDAPRPAACSRSGAARTRAPWPGRSPPPAPTRCRTGCSRSSPAGSASGCGSRWRSPSRRRCCCWTNPPPISTSPTSSRSSTWCAT